MNMKIVQPTYALICQRLGPLVPRNVRVPTTILEGSCQWGTQHFVSGLKDGDEDTEFGGESTSNVEVKE